jgi:hypothetical protein
VRDRKLTTREMAEESGMFYGTYNIIFAEDPAMRRVLAFSSEVLAQKLKQNCLTVLSDLLEFAKTYYDFLKNTTSGNETRAYEIMTQKLRSKLHNENSLLRPRPIKLRQVFRHSGARCHA